MKLENFNSLIELFFYQTEKHDPKSILLQWLNPNNEKTFTWEETKTNIFKLSKTIKENINQGDRCLLVSENRPEWFISDLAIMLSGGITVPAYTTYTEDDYKYLIEDCEPSVIIVSNNDMLKKLNTIINEKNFIKKIITFDEVEKAHHNLNINNKEKFLDFNSIIKNDLSEKDKTQNLNLKRSSVACIIYTSGTGGNPKGVILSHGGILKQFDKLEGNVDSISNRIANVRTWSYVSNKMNWVENQDYWIERTKNLEDKLSDRLHEELTKSFIDKRASVLARGLKQDITFKTEILENRNVLINNQFIGQLNGLKLELDLKTGALDTDIKSLKKAAKQNVEPEILNRIEQIIKTGLIELKDDFKIYWGKFPVASLSPGKDYLKPEINLIVDDIVENVEKINFKKFLQDWINNKINLDLKSLDDLKNIKTTNTSIRALAYQLYENNGVVKRENIRTFLKNINQDERKILRNLGVKFGRYHIFLFKLFKPSAVSLRIALWKNFNQKYFNLKPPTFGLNFLKEKKEYAKDFMLLCGFEKFDSFFVRIDILERLFIQIMNNSKDNNKEIKLIPEMLNLLGCSKEDFLKLIKRMNYSSFVKNNETYFKYTPIKNNKKHFLAKTQKKENPFSVLKNINFK